MSNGLSVVPKGCRAGRTAEFVAGMSTREGLIRVRRVCGVAALLRAGHIGRSSQILAMCGRYASFLRNPLPNFERTWNMAPTGTRPSFGWRAMAVAIWTR